jgi:hypothetical protein
MVEPEENRAGKGSGHLTKRCSRQNPAGFAAELDTLGDEAAVSHLPALFTCHPGDAANSYRIVFTFAMANLSLTAVPKADSFR